jgi:hypothetical protein
MLHAKLSFTSFKDGKSTHFHLLITYSISLSILTTGEVATLVGSKGFPGKTCCYFMGGGIGFDVGGRLFTLFKFTLTSFLFTNTMCTMLLVFLHVYNLGSGNS